MERHLLLIVSVEAFLTVLVTSVNDTILRCGISAVFPDPAVDCVISDIDGALGKTVRECCSLRDALRRKHYDCLLCHLHDYISR